MLKLRKVMVLNFGNRKFGPSPNFFSQSSLASRFSNDQYPRDPQNIPSKTPEPQKVRLIKEIPNNHPRCIKPCISEASTVFTLVQDSEENGVQTYRGVGTVEPRVTKTILLTKKSLREIDFTGELFGHWKNGFELFRFPKVDFFKDKNPKREPVPLKKSP